MTGQTGAADDLAARAIAVLRENDLGGWTKPAPRLYPHQWSWDSAFIALGLAHVDTRRAAEELRALFAAQWATGLVPQIVYNPAADPHGYFPDPDRWACRDLSPDAPATVRTSGICQPPVHAIAALRVWEAARARGGDEEIEANAFLRELYPRLLAWHRYLMTARDPEGSGLVTIYHPWESGTDNSPRWDAALANVAVGDDLPPYTRRDLQHVADPSMRPSNAEYDRYLWLVETLKRARYDDASIYATHPFLVKDILMSAILVAANAALLAIGELGGEEEAELDEIAGWAERGLQGVDRAWDGEFGLALDYDVRAATPVRVRTLAGFAPLIAGGLTGGRLAATLATLAGPDFLDHPDLHRPLPPSTSPNDPAFRPQTYWRGPVWPVMTWLIWWSLVRAGEQALADQTRAAALEQLQTGDFHEYYDPLTGDPLGSARQSWTAAVALDWLRAGG